MISNRAPAALACGRTALVSVLALFAATPQAESNPWYVGGSLTASHESNLLRLGDTQSAPAGYSRGDTVSSAALLAGVDRPFGRQRFQGNLALRSNRYAGNPIFDNQSYTVSTALDWSSVERWSGTLSASVNRALATFNQEEIGLLTQRNIERTQTLDTTVRLGLVAEYALEASAGYRQSDNSLDQANVQSRNYRQDAVSVGVRRQARSAVSYGIALRQTKGRFPKFRAGADGFEADHFTRRDVDLTLNLQASGASSFSGRLSDGSTRYDLAEQRDFSGLTGVLTWAWQPAAKLRLNTSISRDTGQDSYAVTVFNTPGTSNYSRVARAFSVKADYEATAKLALSSSLEYYYRDLVRTIDNPFIPLNAQGQDRSTIFSLGARWAALRWALLGCDFKTERRKGRGELTGDLKSDSFSCDGRFTLQ